MKIHDQGHAPMEFDNGVSIGLEVNVAARFHGDKVLTRMDPLLAHLGKDIPQAIGNHGRGLLSLP